MTGFCAICTATIAEVTRREPLGRNDGMVPVCDGCATKVIVPQQCARPFRRPPSTDRSYQIRANRDQLASEGICTQGRDHGPPTHGRLCTPCWERSRRNESKRVRKATP